jgi:multiple sugar transport system permease protein
MAHIDEAPQQAPAAAPKQGREKRLPLGDRLTVILMVTVPLLFVLLLVWVPALGSVALSFGKWNGFGDLDTIEWVGFQNYRDIATIYPPFWPAIQHNLIWLGFLFLIPTVLGILLAVVLDREMRGGRFYQTAFYMPVVLSLALIGFTWVPRWTGTATPASTCGRCSSPPHGGTPATSCSSTWPA